MNAPESMADGGHATPGSASRAASGDAPVLALLEVLDRDGRARQSVALRGRPISLGRAIDNDLVVDDPHLAAHHAVFEPGPAGELCLRVLPGQNGIRCGERRLAAGGDAVPLDSLSPSRSPAVSAGRGAIGATGAIELTAGLTRLRVRRPGDALEPERALPEPTRGPLLTLLLASALWLWVLAEHGIGLDPGSKASDWLPPLLGVPLAVVGWCLLWGLASKLFQHRFEFWAHVGVIVPGLLAVELVGFALPWLSAITGWPGFARVTTGAAAAIGVIVLLGHARLVLPHQRRALAWTASAAYVAGAAILVALNQQRNERWFAELYSNVLPPPALMWQKPTPREAFVARAERLRPALDKSAAEAAAENRDKGDDDED